MVAASSIMVKTVFKLVVHACWRSLRVFWLKGVLLRVALVGEGVHPMQCHRPQLGVDDVPILIRVPIQVCSEFLVISVHLVKWEPTGQVVKNARILQQLHALVRVFHAVNFSKDSKCFIPAYPTIYLTARLSLC